MSKHILSSSTVWAAMLSLWLSISPTIKIMIVSGISYPSLVDMLDNVAITSLIIIGRYNATTKIFTPKGFPGRDKEG